MDVLLVTEETSVIKVRCYCHVRGDFLFLQENMVDTYLYGSAIDFLIG